MMYSSVVFFTYALNRHFQLEDSGTFFNISLSISFYLFSRPSVRSILELLDLFFMLLKFLPLLYPFSCNLEENWAQSSSLLIHSSVQFASV